jgi:hypothetical protein
MHQRHGGPKIADERKGLNMSNEKLYYHETDGGAKYLTDKFVVCPDGSREGSFEGATLVIRIDGNIREDAEVIKNSQAICGAPEPAPETDKATPRYMCPDCGLTADAPGDCYHGNPDNFPTEMVCRQAGDEPVEHDHDGIWLADLLDYRLSEMKPREKVIDMKFSRGSAMLLRDNLRRDAALIVRAVNSYDAMRNLLAQWVAGTERGAAMPKAALIAESKRVLSGLPAPAEPVNEKLRAAAVLLAEGVLRLGDKSARRGFKVTPDELKRYARAALALADKAAQP